MPDNPRLRLFGLAEWPQAPSFNISPNYCYTYDPFGNRTPHRTLFTGKERDTESGNDHFKARYYSSTMGRFLSPTEARKWLSYPMRSWKIRKH
ncbi:MAG: RHS repeat-associated core domain-containing protein [Terracidiphilus sp.]